MCASKQEITELINKRRYASLLVNIADLQRRAALFDLFFEEYWYVDPTVVPPIVYRHWYMDLLRSHRSSADNPLVIGVSNVFPLFGEPRDHEWLLSHLLE